MDGKRLRCRDVIELLSDYVEGDLPEEKARAIESHLEICPQCVEYLASFRTAIALGKTATSDEVCDELPDDLVRAVLERVRRD